jgi:glucose-6-phosphate 1-epimerase
MTIAELNQKYGVENQVHFFEGEGNLPFVEITNRLYRVVVSLYGAQVMNFIPKGGTDVLWNTNRSFYQEGKAIRGGIPLCFPWFGPHETDSSLPLHGFARLQMWDVQNVMVAESGQILLILELHSNEQTMAMWPYSFTANLSVLLGLSLNVSLIVENTDNKPFTYTDALHSYFRIGNVDAVKVEGLQHKSYVDSLKENQSFEQQEDLLSINQEINRRYTDTYETCIIHDSALNRKISVSKSGSETTVVWNPWVETAKKMEDMNDDDYKTMLCIEAANTLNDTVTVEPGDSESIGTVIKLI